MDGIIIDETIFTNDLAIVRSNKQKTDSFDHDNSSIISLPNDFLDSSDPFNIKKKVDEVIDILDDNSWEADHKNNELPIEDKLNILPGLLFKLRPFS